MNDNTVIIEAYKNADFEKKLYFFLSYRSLRETFTKIDDRQRQLSLDCSSPAKLLAEKRSLLQRLLKWWGIKGEREIRET